MKNVNLHNTLPDQFGTWTHFFLKLDMVTNLAIPREEQISELMSFELAKLPGNNGKDLP